MAALILEMLFMLLCVCNGLKMSEYEEALVLRGQTAFFSFVFVFFPTQTQKKKSGLATQDNEDRFSTYN